MDLSRRHRRRSHGAHASITYQALKIVSIAFSLNRSPGNAVAEKNRGNHFGARGFILAGRYGRVWINHRAVLDMHEHVRDSEREGGARIARWDFFFRKGRMALVLLACALFNFGCASDDDAPRQHRHRHRHGQEQTETMDRSSNPSPSPAP